MGSVNAPDVLYGRPQTVDEIVNGTVGRALARIGVKNDLYFRWLGLGKPPASGNSISENS